MEKSDVIAALTALAHESRLDVFRKLVEYRPDGLSAGRISELLAINPTNLSFHLNQLKNAGLIAARRDGRSLIYTARTEVIDLLTDFLRENCCTAADGDDPSCLPPVVSTGS